MSAQANTEAAASAAPAAASSTLLDDIVEQSKVAKSSSEHDRAKDPHPDRMRQLDRGTVGEARRMYRCGGHGVLLGSDGPRTVGCWPRATQGYQPAGTEASGIRREPRERRRDRWPVPAEGTARDVTLRRDAAVAEMLRARPDVLEYVRRHVLLGEPAADSQLVEKLTALAREQVRQLRAAGLIETTQVGREMINTLRRAEFERRFPGLLEVVLANRPA